jgi:signal transduction histidine kinase
VVLILDPRQAAEVVKSELQSRFKESGLTEEPGSLVWNGPDGNAWSASGKLVDDAKPDEILRHVSRFGDWTLRRFYPVRVVTTYRTPVVAGSFTLAALLLAGGAAVASWQRKAIRVAEERVSFVNRVSHELRTPLTNLLLNTDLALDGLSVEDGKVRRRLGLIREETSRLSRIVDNVLAFARMERGNAETHQTPCDVEKVVGELRENFAPLFERKSILCDYDNRVPDDIRLDRDALSQILSNLLSNVEKYAGESAKARVTLTSESGRFIAEVEDDGPGIPTVARKRVFLPFERAGSRVDEGASGTGLGLAISRELAERMGGRLELMPLAKGARFRLVIPLTERGAV